MMEYNTRDKNIRNSLLLKLRKIHKNANIIPEFTINEGFARVDVAVLCDEIHGYELKGDLDSLVRLNRQKDAYNAIFDKVTLVIGKTHLIDALHIVPDWWGITVAKPIKNPNYVRLVEIREPLRNPNQDYLSIANLLWKKELLDILNEFNKGKGMSNRPKEAICQRFVESVKSDVLKTNVTQTIIMRHSSHFQFA